MDGGPTGGVVAGRGGEGSGVGLTSGVVAGVLEADVDGAGGRETGGVATGGVVGGELGGVVTGGAVGAGGVVDGEDTGAAGLSVRWVVSDEPSC